MKRHSKPGNPRGGLLLRAGLLSRYAWLLHGFSTRLAGNLCYDVAPSGDGAAVARHRRRWLQTLLLGGAGAEKKAKFQLVTLEQVHSDIVRIVDRQPERARREPDGAIKLGGDALITHQPGLLLVVQAADCLPILLVDPVRRVVANVHAGWRGTLARIVEKALGQMRMRFGVQPGGLRAVIGPGIHACCYEVGREVYEGYTAQFRTAKKFLRCIEPSPSEGHWHPKVTGHPLKPPGKQPGSAASGAMADSTRWFLDLVAANRAQLRAAGVPAAHIAVLPYCTACRTDLFFSHRAEAGSTGRQMALIGILLGAS